jgi:pseudouridine kinase
MCPTTMTRIQCPTTRLMLSSVWMRSFAFECRSLPCVDESIVIRFAEWAICCGRTRLSRRGAMLTKTLVVCVGAAAVDVIGHPHTEIPRASNSLGTVHISVGGKARNMAATFASLDCDAHLLSTVGNDLFGDLVIRETAAAGVQVERMKQVQGARTAQYVALLDPAGHLQYAVFDGSIMEALSPQYLTENYELLHSADLIATHTLLPAESLLRLAEMASREQRPWYINLTIPSLATRVFDVIDKSPIIGCDRIEAEGLLGTTIDSPTKALHACRELIAAGASAVILTLDAQGGVYCDRISSYRYLPVSAKRVDATGAGDAFCAAFLAFRSRGNDVVACLTRAAVAAAITMESEHATSPSLSMDAVEQRLSAVDPRTVTPFAD